MSGFGVRVGEDMAVTRYAGWTFHSMCRVDGVVLAADETGLCLLGGDTDDGRPIAASLDLPPVIPDHAAPVRGREFRMRAGAARGLFLKVGTDGGEERRLPLGPAIQGRERRVPLGREAQGRIWNLALENRDGDDFSIEEMALSYVPLDRR